LQQCVHPFPARDGAEAPKQNRMPTPMEETLGHVSNAIVKKGDVQSMAVEVSTPQGSDFNPATPSPIKGETAPQPAFRQPNRERGNTSKEPKMSTLERHQDTAHSRSAIPHAVPGVNPGNRAGRKPLTDEIW